MRQLWVTPTGESFETYERTGAPRRGNPTSNREAANTPLEEGFGCDARGRVAPFGVPEIGEI